MSIRINNEIEITPTLRAKATYDYIVDELKPPVLSRAEFTLLLVIARQTVGWKDIDSPELTKERDWLSMKQLRERTGYGRTTLSKAQEGLSEKGYIFITIDDSHYNINDSLSRYTLDTPQLRKTYGNKYKDKARFHYSLTSNITDIVAAALEHNLSKS